MSGSSMDRHGGCLVANTHTCRCICTMQADPAQLSVHQAADQGRTCSSM